MSKSWVTCSWCNKGFLKDNKYIHENIKISNKFYCSTKCLAASKDKRIELVCENLHCQKVFKRAPWQISLHNYCSGSCAAIVNNYQRWGERPYKKIVLTDEERKAIRVAASSLGGVNRWLNYRSSLTKDYVMAEIKEFVKQNGRLPLKREMNKIYHPARKYFGTWNNAIITAGFKPNPVLFANHQIAKDGHLCDSLAEKIIDDYLFENKINHERRVPYPEGSYTADFKIGDRIVEFFGLAGEHKRYDELRVIKKKLVEKYGLNLIEIYPRDILTKDCLQKILEYN